jgi:glutamate racemase
VLDRMSARATSGSPRRIGVMDWGIGGLGFFKLLRQAAPGLGCVYLSDSGAPPYGTLTRAALTRRVRQAVAWFGERGIDELVVACNAASSVLARLPSVELASSAQAPRRRILGVIEPTLRALLRGPRSSIGIFGGRRTVRSRVYLTPLRRAGFSVQQRVAQPLSALVEAGRISGPEVEREVARIVRPIAGCRLLVPACTHYVALMPLFLRLAPEARWIDPAALTLAALLAPSAQERKRPFAESEFWTTGSPAAFVRGAALAFELEIATIRKLHALPEG